MDAAELNYKLIHKLFSTLWTYQLLGVHVVQYALCVLTVMSALHNSQQQLWCIVLNRGRPKVTCFKGTVWTDSSALMRCSEKRKTKGYLFQRHSLNRQLSFDVLFWKEEDRRLLVSKAQSEQTAQLWCVVLNRGRPKVTRFKSTVWTDSSAGVESNVPATYDKKLWKILFYGQSVCALNKTDIFSTHPLQLDKCYMQSQWLNFCYCLFLLGFFNHFFSGERGG